ncbi:VWA domain-containing protein [Myxococcota bacterium]|nr:VWA domain-containing protein [Myxococcota bacterium]MBU1536895.1 VWA domain-containing protein [Myxococcota bacterium]
MKTFVMLFVFALALTACDDSGEIPPGSEGGACLTGDLCNGDLVCMEGVCHQESASCGNGLLEEGEECEAAIADERTCEEYGYSGGALGCAPDCTLDFSECTEGCGNGVIDPGEECDGDAIGDTTCESLGHRGGNLRCTIDCTYNEASCMPQLARINTNVDILFVIDNSYSMQEEQALLRSNFSTLLTTLRAGIGYLPNVHIGVTTTDLGSGFYSIPSCEGGEMGQLVKGSGNSCNNPLNQMYLVDVDPNGCSITRDASGMCVETDCEQANCDADAFLDGDGNPTEPNGLLLATDDKGCPRCVNYSGESIDAVFSCMADIGVGGCGFEQPMEAMHAALTAGHASNDGFVRETAYLAVILVTDEDDCSVQDDALFDPAIMVPPLNSFRCTLGGVACAEAWATLDSTDVDTVDFSACVSADTGSATHDWLHHLDRYTQVIAQVKGSAALATVAAVAGPYNGQLSVDKDEQGMWRLAPSCTSSQGGEAYPAVRIKELVSYYNAPEQMDWAFTPICATDYAPVLSGVGGRVVGVMGY